MSAGVIEVEAGLFAQDGFNTVLSEAGLVSGVYVTMIS